MIDATRIAERYLAAWNETDAARRDALLAEGWLADATYADPMATVQGRAQIAAVIAAVQERFPGFRFALAGTPDGYADKVRFSWSLGPAQAPDTIQGTDFAVVDAEGRLCSVTGFLDKVPTAS
ncbi:nuclear transport factor 2 family protein [Verticiella sediminum]|uniref:Nuclear transport factor 2 family protein n=1 Tax=Verticiella sediminum TaxID=1247510 RepID=A0A556ACJ1_9BURK|nr:nuclear transport factor 2 family protein [Verticiella sediminum]TSH90616.1 nuclear transport factor 2 family protein [Verticiella sediminum]